MIKLKKRKDACWVDNLSGHQTAEWVVKKAPEIVVGRWTNWLTSEGFGWCAIETGIPGISTDRILVRNGMTRKDCLERLEAKRPELGETN